MDSIPVAGQRFLEERRVWKTRSFRRAWKVLHSLKTTAAGAKRDLELKFTDERICAAPKGSDPLGADSVPGPEKKGQGLQLECPRGGVRCKGEGAPARRVQGKDRPQVLRSRNSLTSLQRRSQALQTGCLAEMLRIVGPPLPPHLFPGRLRGLHQPLRLGCKGRRVPWWGDSTCT